MPSPTDFKQAFHFENSTELRSKAGRVLGVFQSSKVGHDVKKQNELYEFPTTVALELAGAPLPSKQALTAATKAHFAATLTVHSAYGSPYTCRCKEVKLANLDKEEQTATIKFLGVAKRRRDVPTLAQQKAEERQKRGVGEASEEDIKQWLGGQRVIKSRFATSKCALCGETIDPGVKIARDERGGSKKVGGWAHATCAVESARKQHQKKNSAAEEKEAGAKKQPAVKKAGACGKGHGASEV